MVLQQFSHYQIIKKLGQGGMGEVFLAEDTTLERKVAIKTLPADSLADTQARRRLFREAKAAAILDHPNICAIHEVNEDGDCPFIVMQYINGETLSSKAEKSAIAPEEVIKIGIQVAEALSEAHSHGMVHRDIKPQNLMITPRGQVKVLDFGLVKVQPEHSDAEAKTVSQLTQHGYLVGTVGYMSPEQLKGDSIDGRSDLFSLGVTLYECATGKPAFTGNSKIEISSKVLYVEPPKPSFVKPGFPLGLEDVIVKAMAKDVEKRYQSAGAMLEDLYRLEASLSTGTQVLPRFSESSDAKSLSAGAMRTLRRNPIKVVLLSLLMIVGIVAAFRLWRSSPYQPTAEASKWYDRGTEAIRTGAYYQASKLLQESIKIDPRFALAHARLAETYVETDYSEKSMEELLLAMSLVPNRSTLTSQDANYFDAIAATVRRDFAAAIESYDKILKQSSPAEKSNAFLDLGRAYEKNENPDKATEFYTAATKADPQSAAAFMRLAVMYGRRQDLSSANDAFDKAEALFQALSNPEGQAEVLYQRGTLLSKIRRLAESKPLLEKALEISRSNNIQYQIVKTQLELSSVYFAEGDTERAKKIATDAISQAQANNVRNLATNGLIDLGYTLIWRGELTEAAQYFKRALDFAQADKARRIEARARLGLGTVDFQQGNLDEAISLLEEARKFYEPAGYRKETSIVLLTLARARRNKGEYENALKTFEQQLQLAKNLDDPAQLAASHLSMGILLGEYLERYPEALSHLDESYRIDQSVKAKVGIADDQLYRGAVLAQLGRYQEARDALDQAASIAKQPGADFREVLAWIVLTESRMALSERRFAEAKTKGQQALELAGTQVKDLVIQAKYSIGLAQAFSGSLQPGRKLCDEALALAKEGNSPRLISNALLALAEVLLKTNDSAGALANAMQAQPMFAQSGQQESEWRAWLVAARAGELAGNTAAMKDYASRADSLCAGLQQKWGAEAYTSYLQRKDIQAYRDELSQMLSRGK